MKNIDGSAGTDRLRPAITEDPDLTPAEKETTTPATPDERARFLERTSALNADHARALAYREVGYSRAGVADMLGCAEATVTARLERVVAQYGPEAVETKQPDERGRTRLSPLTRANVVAFPAHLREVWKDAARAHPDETPAWHQTWLASDGTADGAGVSADE